MTASHDRLLELLTDRATVGLGSREQIELAELLVHAQDIDIATFDKAAAAIALASVGTLEKMPANIAERIEQAALGALGASSRPASDFMRTRELEKLAPPLVTTQVDPLVSLTGDELEPAPNDFKRTQMMDDRPRSAPARPPAPPTARMPSSPLLGTSAQPSVSSMSPPLGYAPTSGRPAGPSSGPVSAAPSNVVPFPASTRAQASAPSRVVAISGWIAAAACLLLAIGAFVLRRPPAPVATLPAPPSTTTPTPSPVPPPATVASMTPAELRAKLLASEGSARAEWTPTKDPLGKSASGEVVWNKDQQKGTMRFSGLAKNDPSRAQYQLWIFDKTRDEKYPVDGGVFDVDSDTGDVIVPIRATLPVNAPVLFAVTLERPGGVVVSKREHIVVTAKLPAG